MSATAPCQSTTCPRVASTAAFVRGRLESDAAVDLAPAVGEEIEGAALLQVRERIRARSDRLRLERRGRPLLRHLGGDDALDVRLEADGVHHLQRLAVGREP